MYSLFTLTLVALVSTVFSNSKTPVIVLSFDDFHPKYMTSNDTPYLKDILFSKGAGPPYMTSIFPPTTFVTHFTLSTGVYPETHGVYNDVMFDENEEVVQNTKSQFQFNKNISPIWIENENAGGHSAVMMWPGSEFGYNGIAPTYIQKYDKNMSWKDRANKIVEWMNNENNKPNLVMAIFEDNPCYDKRYRENHLNNYKKKVDDTIRQIYDELAITLQNFNMIIMSDHGTDPVKSDEILLLETIVSDQTNATIILSGPLVFIRPNEGYFDYVLNQITKSRGYNVDFDVFVKDSIPNHLKMNTRNLDKIIVLFPKYGYTILPRRTFSNLQYSVGGKDNLVLDKSVYNSSRDTKMNAFFLGIGPSFKNNVTTGDPFNIIDVYAILKHLLSIPTAKNSYERYDTLNDTVKLILN